MNRAGWLGQPAQPLQRLACAGDHFSRLEGDPLGLQVELAGVEVVEVAGEMLQKPAMVGNSRIEALNITRQLRHNADEVIPCLLRPKAGFRGF